MRTSKTSAAVAAAALLLALTACSSPASGGGGDADAGGAASDAATAEGTGSDAGPAGTDVCALVPAAELIAAVGTDPGAGVADRANGLSNCTWTIDDTPSVIAQIGDAATYFPTDLYPKPDGAVDLSGGWASAEQRTVFLVVDGQGLMLNDFAFGTAPGDQDAWTALGTAIAANL